MDTFAQDFKYFPSNMSEAHKIIEILRNTINTNQKDLTKLRNELTSATNARNGDELYLEEKFKLLEAEEELNKLKNEFKLLEEDKFTLQMVILLQEVKEVNNQTSTKTCNLSQQEEDNKHNYEQELESYVIEYDKLCLNLKNQGIFIQKQKFPNLLDHFIKLLRQNDIKRKDAFKIASEIEQNCKNKVEGIQKFISRSINEMKSLIEEENNRLIEFKKISFLNDFSAEQKQYQDLLEVVTEETAFLRNLLDMGVISTSKIPNTSKNGNIDDEDTELLSNNLNSEHMAKPWRNKSFDNLINKNLCEKENKYSVILLNFPEFDSDKKDVFEVMCFLMKELNIKDIDMTISRLGYQQDNVLRPVVVTLSNETIYNDILNQANQQHFYEGTNIEIRKYDEF